MSRKKLWQICHNRKSGNSYIAETIVKIMKDKKLTTKQIASDLVIPTERVRNWYYKNTCLTAWDLLLLMSEYDFIKKHVDEMFIE
ncbi:hypothetical protein [Desulfovibrio sp. TomC]|uniref:hypothetical protein n=1 Tax=Desulfovibrio sp. TomC TaxID=1562888 RepID=UPI0005BB7CE7|nr:hypothetical protein [Desulfovibrio sp. TomC]